MNYTKEFGGWFGFSCISRCLYFNLLPTQISYITTSFRLILK